MPRQPATIARVAFRAPAGPGVALEVMPIDELRRRAPPQRLQTPHRVEFHQLVFVTGGRCEHGIDFLTHDARAGSWLLVRPGQVQRFGASTRWSGWVLVLRPDLLLPQTRGALFRAGAAPATLDALPDHLVLSPPQRHASLRCVEQMERDTRGFAPGPELDDLLCRQLQTLVLRLHLAWLSQGAHASVAPASVQRFERLRTLVDQRFHEWHQLGRYAAQLGCTERSLTRASLQMCGMSAKAWLTQRIVLEAKRLLAHTAAPVASVAHELGFGEAGNFAKYFKRETGALPVEFRRQQGGVADPVRERRAVVNAGAPAVGRASRAARRP
jgi:AraC-like DNA-binding protein